MYFYTLFGKIKQPHNWIFIFTRAQLQISPQRKENLQHATFILIRSALGHTTQERCILPSFIALQPTCFGTVNCACVSERCPPFFFLSSSAFVDCLLLVSYFFACSLRGCGDSGDHYRSVIRHSTTPHNVVLLRQQRKRTVFVLVQTQ